MNILFLSVKVYFQFGPIEVLSKSVQLFSFEIKLTSFVALKPVFFVERNLIIIK